MFGPVLCVRTRPCLQNMTEKPGPPAAWDSRLGLHGLARPGGYEVVPFSLPVNNSIMKEMAMVAMLNSQAREVFPESTAK
jgi:hypothetical protein